MTRKGLIHCKTKQPTHCWKDSSGVPLSSVVMTRLVAKHSKWVPLMIPLVCERKKSHTVKSDEWGGFFSKVMFLSVGNYQKFSIPSFITLSMPEDMLKSSVIYFQTCSFFMSGWLAIIQMVNQHSLHPTCLTHSTLISVRLVESFPLLESSFTSSCSSLNLFVPFKSPSALYGVISIHLL